MTREASLGPRVAGGSSGGSASAVAAGAVVLAVGSDTGGSVRLPAAYCGVVGFKPSYGHLSRWGLVPYVSSMDTPGFLARSVSDAAVAMYTCHGADPLDSTSVDVNTNELLRWLETNDEVSKHLRGSTGDFTGADQRPPSFLRSRVGMPLAGWRVGVPIEYDVAEISDEVRVEWSETCELLERLGATVVKVSLPSTAAAHSNLNVSSKYRSSVVSAITACVRAGPGRPRRGARARGRRPRGERAGRRAEANVVEATPTRTRRRGVRRREERTEEARRETRDHDWYIALELPVGATRREPGSGLVRVGTPPKPTE